MSVNVIHCLYYQMTWLSCNLGVNILVFHSLSHVCGNTLWKNYALWKNISKCVKFGTKSTHFEFFSESIKLRTNLMHFENISQSALRVYINITFDVDFNELWRKKSYKKWNVWHFHLIDWIFKCYNSFLDWD